MLAIPDPRRAERCSAISTSARPGEERLCVAQDAAASHFPPAGVLWGAMGRDTKGGAVTSFDSEMQGLIPRTAALDPASQLR